MTKAATLTTPSRRNSYRIFLYVTCTVLAAMFATPFLWALSTSLKDASSIYIDPPQWIPSPVVLRNYVQAMQLVPFHVYFQNTIIITVLAGIGRVFVSSVIAYGFARFQFPGRDVLFVILLGTMMIPDQVLIVPRFLLFNLLGWVNTFLPLIVPAFFGATPFMIFLARQFLMSLPRELDEAAEVDGAGPVTIFIRILLPLSKPFLATAAILSFQGDWNAFLPPLVYLQNQTKYTIALGLRYISGLSGGEGMAGLPMDHLIMAASIAALMPVVVIFLVFQKYFVRGIVMSGIKG